MIKTVLCALFFSATCASTARGQMLNQVVDVEWRYPTLPQVYDADTVTVSSIVEVPATLDSSIGIDLGDDWVEFRFASPTGFTTSSFNGWSIRDRQGTIPPITGYVVDSFSAGVANVGVVTTGFNDDECWASFAGLTIQGSGETLRLRVEFNSGTPFCFGDNSDTACNCGNVGATGAGCSNSTGLGSTLSTTGTGSIAANDFALHGSQLPPNTTALFFSGAVTLSPGVLFGDGLRCAGGPITRLQVLLSNSQGMASTSISLSAALAAQPGSQSNFQIWYRDVQGPCSTGFNTSSAIELTWH